VEEKGWERENVRTKGKGKEKGRAGKTSKFGEINASNFIMYATQLVLNFLD